MKEHRRIKMEGRSTLQSALACQNPPPQTIKPTPAAEGTRRTAARHVCCYIVKEMWLYLCGGDCLRHPDFSSSLLASCGCDRL